MAKLTKDQVIVDLFDQCKALQRRNAELEEENERLRREVAMLRLYGNRDCTVMADEALANEVE